MHRISIAQPDFALDADDPPGFRAGYQRLAPLLGASLLGATVYELPAGEALCPYHYEYGEEEWLLVLAGRPSVRHPEGVDALEPLDLVVFPPGPTGAHQVRHDGDEPARVLMFSNRCVPAASVYPDSDKIGIWTGEKADDLLVRRTSGVGYWEGEAPAST